LVAKLSARMDELMKAQGLTQGTVGQRLRAMYQDPRFRYPNTDEGKAKLLADLNGKVQTVQAKLPQWFGTLPKATVQIKRVPPYIEACALYAEQLADEMGMYENDPWGRIGYLHDTCFRAVRLVVDTGMHAMRWSREQAIQYMVETIGDQDASATTEIERYCVW